MHAALLPVAVAVLSHELIQQRPRSVHAVGFCQRGRAQSLRLTVSFSFSPPTRLLHPQRAQHRRASRLQSADYLFYFDRALQLSSSAGCELYTLPVVGPVSGCRGAGGLPCMESSQGAMRPTACKGAFQQGMLRPAAQQSRRLRAHAHARALSFYASPTLAAWERSHCGAGLGHLSEPLHSPGAIHCKFPIKRFGAGLAGKRALEPAVHQVWKFSDSCQQRLLG